MRIKKTLFALAFLFLSFLAFTSNAQVEVIYLKKKISTILYSTTTYFIVPTFDADKKEIYEKILKEVWTVTPIKVITAQEAQQPEWKKDPLKNSVFHLSLTGRVFPDGRVDYNPAFVLDVPYINSKNQIAQVAIATIPLLYNSDKNDELGLWQNHTLEAWDSILDIKSYYINYVPGYMKNYISAVNGFIITNTADRRLANAETDEEATKKALTETIYIPDYVAENSSGIDELMAKAKFKYKKISTDELNAMILKNEAPFYYLSFTRLLGFKTVNIINSRTGQISFSSTTFSNLQKYSASFNETDVKRMNKFVK